MDAILVDQVTAIYVVLAVAMAIFGGIYAFVWRFAGQAGLKGNSLQMGFVGLVVLWGALGVMALARVVTTVDLMLAVAAVSVLVAWILVFSALSRLDGATSASPGPRPFSG
jgi:hypothetical protein